MSFSLSLTRMSGHPTDREGDTLMLLSDFNSTTTTATLESYGSTIVTEEEDNANEQEVESMVDLSLYLSDSLDNDDDDNNASLLQQQQRQAIFLLNAVAVIWGTQHAVIKTVVAAGDEAVGDTSTAALFTLIRFALAALLASPYTPGLRQLLETSSNSKPLALQTNGEMAHVEGNNNDNVDIATLWRWGAELGVWMFCGFAFQAIGLQYTTAQKSGFLLYLNCKFVPLFAAVLLGRRIGVPTWLSAGTAVVGTGLLAVGGDDATLMNQWNVGDVWSIAAAMTSAMFILRMEAASEAVQDQASELNAACLWVVAALSVVWTAAATTTDPNTTLQTMVDMAQDSWLAFLYLGGIATAVCNWLQTKAQRHVSAERACVIYAMDPVYGAVFSAWWLGESLPGTAGYVGAGLITVAAATNALFLEPNGTKDKPQQG